MFTRFTFRTQSFSISIYLTAEATTNFISHLIKFLENSFCVFNLLSAQRWFLIKFLHFVLLLRALINLSELLSSVERKMRHKKPFLMINGYKERSLGHTALWKWTNSESVKSSLSVATLSALRLTFIALVDEKGKQKFVKCKFRK